MKQSINDQQENTDNHDNVKYGQFVMKNINTNI